LVIYTIDEKGRKPRHVLPIYDGVLTSADALFELLTSYLVALDVSDAQQVIFIADGAPEHWPRVTLLREALNLDPARVVEVFDWAHAVEHLTTVANAFPTWSDKRRTRWLKTQRSHLKQGHLRAVLQALQLLAKGRSAQTVGQELTFLATHAHRMRYGAFRKRGIPLGSGAVESGLRRLVNLRMKGPGIFWTPQHAQDLFYLRCQLLSGRWEAFVRALLFPDQAVPQASDHQAAASYVRQAA
jgi:hypothetical protein